MPLPAITYQSLSDLVKNWMKTNCANIANYGGMHACVKDGFKFEAGSSGGSAYVEKVTGVISSPVKFAIPTSKVDTDMTAFLQVIGSPSGIITPEDFYPYLNNLACFAATKLAFVSSRYNKDAYSLVKYLIYWANESDWIKNVPSVEKMIDVSDTKLIIENLISIMVRNEGYIRVVPVKISYTLS